MLNFVENNLSNSNLMHEATNHNKEIHKSQSNENFNKIQQDTSLKDKSFEKGFNIHAKPFQPNILFVPQVWRPNFQQSEPSSQTQANESKLDTLGQLMNVNIQQESHSIETNSDLSDHSNVDMEYYSSIGYKEPIQDIFDQINQPIQEINIQYKKKRRRKKKAKAKVNNSLENELNNNNSINEESQKEFINLSIKNQDSNHIKPIQSNQFNTFEESKVVLNPIANAWLSPRETLSLINKNNKNSIQKNIKQVNNKPILQIPSNDNQMNNNSNDNFPILSSKRQSKKSIESYMDAVLNGNENKFIETPIYPNPVQLSRNQTNFTQKVVQDESLIHPIVKSFGVTRIALSEYLPKEKKVSPREVIKKKNVSLAPKLPDENTLQDNVNSLIKNFLRSRTPMNEIKRISITIEKGKIYKMEDLDPTLPKKKKLKRMKRVILQEREEKHQEDKTTKRKVREFVSTKLSEQTDNNVKDLLSKLAFFQKRLQKTQPLKYKQHKRLAIGLNETLKACQRGKAKAIIMAPDIEKITAKGGLDSLIGNILRESGLKEIPVIFALNRRKIGVAIKKSVHISVVCIINAEGAFEELNKLLNEVEYLEDDESRKKKKNQNLKDASPMTQRKNDENEEEMFNVQEGVN